MTPLENLRRFCLADHDPGELREYATAHQADLAEAFGVPVEKYLTALEEASDDATLPDRILGSIKARTSKLRKENATGRSVQAQLAADALTASTYWDRGRAYLDFPALKGALAGGTLDLIVFKGDAFEVAICNGPIRAIAQIKKGLTGWVDAEGLHVRWSTGGLNLIPQSVHEQSQITINLPPVTQVAPPPEPIAPVVIPPKKAKPMKKSVDDLITEFQNACLEKLAAVEAQASAEIAALTAERDSLLSQLQERDAWIAELQQAGAQDVADTIPQPRRLRVVGSKVLP